ncbi:MULTISPECIES: phage protease [unclassified Moraxella]|uniref:phage protease n=1 Tax=unclassified Moraxella TaxID=2685852 RepID=UPI003AF72A4A
MKLSALSLALNQTGIPANHFLIFPEGTNIKAVDGRPDDVDGWVMQSDNGTALATALNQSAKDLVIDYEHQTILAKENGKPAPAAGWLKAGGFVYVDGVGLCSTQYNFTKKAQEYIDNKEYRFKSPVILYDNKGVVNGLHSVALTNDPALTILDELKPTLLTATISINQPSSNQSQQDNPMNKLLALVVASLGLPTTTTEDQAVTALSQNIDVIKTKATAKGLALDDSQTLASLTAELDKVGEPIPATLEQKEPDPAKYVPIEVVTALNEQIAQLQGNQKDPAEEAVQEALSNGQLLPAQQNWAMLYAKQDLAGFTAFLAKQPKITALTQSQTAGKPVPPTQTQVALTADVELVAQQMGLDAKDLVSNMAG